MQDFFPAKNKAKDQAMADYIRDHESQIPTSYYDSKPKKPEPSKGPSLEEMFPAKTPKQPVRAPLKPPAPSRDNKKELQKVFDNMDRQKSKPRKSDLQGS